MRTLLVCREGAPLFPELTSGPVREYLRSIEGVDDPLLYQIWHIEGIGHTAKTADITKRFAASWGREIEFGEGIEPEDYLAPFPAFVVANLRRQLVRRWNAEHASRARVITEIDFIPDALRRTA